MIRNRFVMCVNKARSINYLFLDPLVCPKLP
jgi:hypothetical protein